MGDGPLHTPVLAEECLALLDPRPGDLVVDATVGAGGHAERILERLGPDGLLLGLDRDPEAVEAARERLRGYGGRCALRHALFTEVPRHLRELGREPAGSVDGLLADLGVSSMQLDRPERGFAFRYDAPLDLRMDPTRGETAAAWLARVSVRELESTLREYGDERKARRIARVIDRARRKGPVDTTRRLAELVESVVPRRGGRIHPATRTFQAIRIAVNRELDLLRDLLRDADRWLAPGGRLVVLSYHSLEDRLVKRIVGQRVREGIYRWLTRGVVRPGPGEVQENPRARSARLRAAVRTGGEPDV